MPNCANGRCQYPGCHTCNPDTAYYWVIDNEPWRLSKDVLDAFNKTRRQKPRLFLVKQVGEE